MVARRARVILFGCSDIGSDMSDKVLNVTASIDAPTDAEYTVVPVSLIASLQFMDSYSGQTSLQHQYVYGIVRQREEEKLSSCILTRETLRRARLCTAELIAADVSLCTISISCDIIIMAV